MEKAGVFVNVFVSVLVRENQRVIRHTEEKAM